jgi:hypothetical protein
LPAIQVAWLASLITVGMGSSVPVAVTACPHPDSSSCRVVDTMMVHGLYF